MRTRIMVGLFLLGLLALPHEEGIVVGPARPRDYPQGVVDPCRSIGFRSWLLEPEKGLVMGT